MRTFLGHRRSPARRPETPRRECQDPPERPADSGGFRV